MVLPTIVGKPFVRGLSDEIKMPNGPRTTICSAQADHQENSITTCEPIFRLPIRVNRNPISRSPIVTSCTTVTNQAQGWQANLDLFRTLSGSFSPHLDLFREISRPQVDALKWTPSWFVSSQTTLDLFRTLSGSFSPPSGSFSRDLTPSGWRPQVNALMTSLQGSDLWAWDEGCVRKWTMGQLFAWSKPRSGIHVHGIVDSFRAWPKTIHDSCVTEKGHISFLSHESTKGSHERKKGHLGPRGAY